MVVFPSPVFDDDSGFQQCIKDLSIEQLIPEPADKGLHVAVLPGAAGFYEERPHTRVRQPLSDRLGREDRVIIRPKEFRCAPIHEQLVELIQDILVSDPAGPMER